MILALLAAAALSSAEPTAVDQAAPAAPQAQELKPNQRIMKVVCRDEIPTGTRFAKRVCTPVEELRAREEAARDAMTEASRQYQLETGN